MSIYDGKDWNPEDQTKCFECGEDIPHLISGINVCQFDYNDIDEDKDNE